MSKLSIYEQEISKTPFTKEELRGIHGDNLSKVETRRLILTINQLWDAAENERFTIVKWLKGLAFRPECPEEKSRLYRDIAWDIAVDCEGLKAIREGRA